MVMAKRICKGNPQYEDVAHYVIESALTSQKDLPDDEVMKYLSGMIWLSFFSKTSPYHKEYRQSGKVHELYDYTADKLVESDYNLEKDLLTEEIYGILEDMKAESIEQWHLATLMEMYTKHENYSEISRRTGIPRTSISQAVEECRQHILLTLKNRNIDYDY